MILRSGAALMLMLMLIGAAGCDEVPFDPFPDAQPIYSIAGFLNASSDTQWVRVMPIREGIVTPRTPIDALVTLDRLPGGRSAILSDSIFRFDEELLPDSEEAIVHNFWTTLPIEPGASYRLRVERSDGAAARAVVTIPADFAITIVHRPGVTPAATLRLEDVDHLAMVHVRLVTAGRPCYSSIYGVPEAVDGVHSLTITRSFPPEAALLCDVEGDVDVFVVASGAPWPAGAQFDQAALNMPSSIERGVGFLGGVLSRSIPWEYCVMSRQGDPCELTYGDDSAALVADVRVASCGVPAYGAQIRLIEVATSSSTSRRIRMTRMRPGDEASIEALAGGRLHELTITHPDPSYSAYTDTIRFQPGEIAKRTFMLARSAPC